MKAYDALAMIERLLKRGAAYQMSEEPHDADCHVAQSTPNTLVVTCADGTAITVTVGPVVQGEGLLPERRKVRRRRGEIGVSAYGV